MAEEQLRKAYGLMKKGQTKESLAIVQGVLKQDKNNVPAWWMMTNLLADDPERQKKALEKVLSLDPQHKLALQLQSKLTGKPAPKSTATPQATQSNNKSTEEINVDWGKLEAKEQGKKDLDEAKASQMVKITSYAMLAFVVLILVSIGGYAAYNSYLFSQSNTPSATILRFYDAALRGDIVAARLLVCPDVQPTFDTLSAILTANNATAKAQLGEGAVISYDFSGLTAEVVSEDGTTATVRVAGEFVMSAPQAPEPVEPVTHEVIATEDNLDQLRLENGVWCVAKIE